MRPGKKAEQLARATEHILTYLALGDITEQRGGDRVQLHDFTGAEPLLPVFTQITEDVYGDDEIIFADAKPTDLDSPLNIAFIAEDPDDPQGFCLSRHRAVSPADVRGKVSRLTRYLVETKSAWLDGEGQGMGTTQIFGSNNGLDWRMTAAGYEHNADEGLHTRRVQIAHGMAFTREFFWTVRLGWVGHPNILIPTDPVGARAVFRLRDIPEGKQRRAALKHWVSEHWRQTREDESEEVFVREHLRGKERFVWNGLVCEIRPSVTDRKRAMRAIEEREEMKDAGEDRRLAITT
jgi:hypothetical protein